MNPKADIREPSEDYIKQMMYVVNEHSHDLSEQQVFDITHTLIMSGFYTGMESVGMAAGISTENLRDVPRGTVNSSTVNEPVIKTENQYEMELTKELGSATSGPFSESIDPNKWALCKCEECKKSGLSGREFVRYDYATFCTSHPFFVDVCEFCEDLSGEEVQVLSDAVKSGLVKRTKVSEVISGKYILDLDN